METEPFIPASRRVLYMRVVGGTDISHPDRPPSRDLYEEVYGKPYPSQYGFQYKQPGRQPAALLPFPAPR